MRVSIGIPAYNAERFLAATVESVLAQSVVDWELRIVDDGSQDDTFAVAQRYAERDRRIRAATKPNEGVCLARSNAFETMSPDTPYVIFLDADDLWEPDALALLIEALEADAEAPAAHGDARFIDAQGVPFHPGALETWCSAPRNIVSQRLETVPAGRTSFTVLAYRCCIVSPGAVLIRRQALPSAEMWDPRTCPCEDWDLWLRLSARTAFAYVDRVVLNYRRHSSNLTADRARMTAADYYVRRKVLTRSEFSEAQKRTMHRAFRLLKQQTGRERRETFRARLRQGRYGSALQELTATLRCYASALRGIPGAR